MVSYVWTHSRWLSQLAAHIRIKVGCDRILVIRKGWILLSQTDEIESGDMILAYFLNRILLNDGRNNLRFYFLISLLFAEDIGNLWNSLSLSLWNVIVNWLITIFIAWLVTWWLTRFLRKWLIVVRLERGVLEEGLWNLLSYWRLISWLFALYP